MADTILSPDIDPIGDQKDVPYLLVLVNILSFPVISGIAATQMFDKPVEQCPKIHVQVGNRQYIPLSIYMYPYIYTYIYIYICIYL